MRVTEAAIRERCTEGRQEKDDNLALALAVGSILAENGVDVVYTRTDDSYETPFQKAQKGNQAGADLFISIHRNSSPENDQYSGVETLVYDESGIKKALAENINRELAQAGFQNLGHSGAAGPCSLKTDKNACSPHRSGLYQHPGGQRASGSEF